MNWVKLNLDSEKPNYPPIDINRVLVWNISSDDGEIKILEKPAEHKWCALSFSEKDTHWSNVDPPLKLWELCFAAAYPGGAPYDYKMAFGVGFKMGFERGGKNNE